MSKDLVVQTQGAVVPFAQQQALASAIAESGMFGIKTPQQAIVLMALCEAEGLHPVRAANDYHIIGGRPAMKAEAMMARFQRQGGIVSWLENSDTRCAAMFSHPASPDPVTIDWDIERAKKAQLLNNPQWHKYPRAMLRSRVVSEGIRTVFPGVLSGMYTPEEVRDFHVVKSDVIEFFHDDAAAVVAGFVDKAAMRNWLKGEAAHRGWKKGDPQYEGLIARCMERAKEIDRINASSEAGSNEGPIDVSLEVEMEEAVCE